MLWCASRVGVWRGRGDVGFLACKRQRGCSFESCRASCGANTSSALRHSPVLWFVARYSARRTRRAPDRRRRLAWAVAAHRRPRCARFGRCALSESAWSAVGRMRSFELRDCGRDLWCLIGGDALDSFRTVLDGRRSPGSRGVLGRESLIGSESGWRVSPLNSHRLVSECAGREPPTAIALKEEVGEARSRRAAPYVLWMKLL